MLSKSRARRAGSRTTLVTTLGLSRRQAIPIAVASIAGSGILFLPSAVVAAAGPDCLIIWVVAVAMCVPMLLMFDDVVRAHPDSDGIEAFVRAGLGDRAARTVPFLFAAIVTVGLPGGAMVVGHFVASALGVGNTVALLAGSAVLATAVVANLGGARTSLRVQHAAVVGLVVFVLALIAAAASGVPAHFDAVEPGVGPVAPLLPTVLLAFFAFAGFENLTLLSREFRDPRRDFLPVSAIALAIYGVLTIALTVVVATRIPRGRVSAVTGLLQLAQTLQPRALIVATVIGIAFGAMTLNASAWVWGVSRVLDGAARTGAAPRWIASPATSGVPRRAILVLAVPSAATMGVLAMLPNAVIDAVGAAGATFAVLYILSIVAYLRRRGFGVRSCLNGALLLVLGTALAASGWRAAYALGALAAALIVSGGRTRSSGAAGSAREIDAPPHSHTAKSAA